MTQIISFNQSNIANKALVPNFAQIVTGDILTLTNDVFCKKMSNGNTVEMFVFKNQDGQRVILGMNQILRSYGSVNDSFQMAIWNKDIKTGKDIFFILRDHKICVTNVCTDKHETLNGFKLRVNYVLDWC